jgi:PAS domain S-box-containing protein
MLTLTPELARKALDAAPDAMIIIDADGYVRYASTQASALFGYGHDELVGHPVEQLMPQRLRPRHLLHRQHYQRAQRLRAMGAGLQLFGQRRDGSEFPVEISLSPLADGERALVAAAIRDVTDRKRVEAELITARQEAESARELADEARQTADRANLSKSRFLATASHDLRQPLQTLGLLNGAMRRENSDPIVAEALIQQQQSIDAMGRLLNALLDISKLESGAIRPEITDFSVSATFEELRAEFEQLALQKGLQFKVEQCDDCVRSDPGLLGQALRNLVSNAIKYTRQGWVQLRCRHEQSWVRLEVLDSGIGMPAQDIPRIFDEFYQIGVASNASRDGYGLGLSIVRRIVELLDARLEVHSEMGCGSAFSLTLPWGGPQRQAEQRGRVATPPRAAAPRKLLLVEDDPAVRAATKLLLRSAGYQAFAAGSESEALGYVDSNPDLGLVVADFHLAAGETGLQVIASVRARLGRAVPAVLVTGDTSSAVHVAAEDRHLRIASKPIHADQLLALLEQLH